MPRFFRPVFRNFRPIQVGEHLQYIQNSSILCAPPIPSLNHFNKVTMGNEINERYYYPQKTQKGLKNVHTAKFTDLLLSFPIKDIIYLQDVILLVIVHTSCRYAEAPLKIILWRKVSNLLYSWGYSLPKEPGMWMSLHTQCLS